MHGNGNTLVQERIIDILKASLGPCGELLEDDRLIELQVNDDGRVWVRWQGMTRSQATEYWMPETQRENVLRIVAGRMDSVCNARQPSLSTILPSGERFQGFRQPIAPGPGFVVRKPALKVFTLADYVQAGIATPQHAETLMQAVRRKRNLLIGGGTVTGKTTFANALLAVMAEDGERIITLEDTPELQCPAPNTVHKYTKPGVKTMQELVQDVLREGPDRIVLGEVRGVEAVDLMDAWATGHPGGLCTVHAGSAAGVLPRLEQLMRRANIPQEVAREMLGNAQPVIAYLERTPTGRVLKELVSVEGYANGAYQLGEPSEKEWYMKRTIVIVALLLVYAAVAPVVMHAAAANPWEQPLTDISTSVVGPVALAGFLIALGLFCLMWCMGYAAVGVAVGIVVAGAILGNAESIASWLGVGG